MEGRWRCCAATGVGREGASARAVGEEQVKTNIYRTGLVVQGRITIRLHYYASDVGSERLLGL